MTENKPPVPPQPVPHQHAPHAPHQMPDAVPILEQAPVEPGPGEAGPVEPGPAEPPPRVDRLEAFLGAVDRFIPEITTLAVRAAPRGEYPILMQASGDTSARQMRKLTGLARKLAAGLSPSQRIELDEYLDLQDGEALVQSGIDVFGNILGNGMFGKVVQWIMQHLFLIKKLLKWLLGWLIEKLGLKSTWLGVIAKLIEWIDEDEKRKYALLASAMGEDHATIARELSELEVNFLHELTALEGLEAAIAARR